MMRVRIAHDYRPDVIVPEFEIAWRSLWIAIAVQLAVSCCQAAVRREHDDTQELIYALRYAAVLHKAGLHEPADPVAFERCIRLESGWLECACNEVGGDR